ncbi:MAG: hypothetical protein C0592_13385, partial [Marinilabiliales bacterium]
MKIAYFIAGLILAFQVHSQDIVFVKDSIMDEYMVSGVSSKEFIPEGRTDPYGKKQGFWTDYEVRFELAFIFKNGTPQQVGGQYLIYGEGDYLNDLRTGEWMFYTIEDITFKKFPLKKLAFKNGKATGQLTYFYPDGNIALQGKVKNGNFSGKFTGYYPSGKISSKYNFKNGWRHGEIIDYFESGQIKARRTFKKDSLVGTYTSYYPNGQVEEISHFRDNKAHGSYKYFHPNGQLWTERIYEDDKTMEVLCNYDSKGKSRDKGTLKNGNGTMILYDREDNVYAVQTFVNGEMTESENVEG